MRLSIRAALCAAVLAGFPFPATADETTYCNRMITSLPYTITVQGHYCFERNLSTAISSGNAITINVDFVVLDLNNFKLGGGAAGLGTMANGVYGVDRKNVTVRNGNIRGFARGIYLQRTPPTHGTLTSHVVENNVVDGNTVEGIHVEGHGNLVRNNLVTNTGGSTAITTFANGILSWHGVSRVSDNTVVGVFGGSDEAVGVNGSYIGGLVEGNLVAEVEGPSFRGGVAGQVCRDNVVLISSPGAVSCYTEVDNINSIYIY
jgi:hypothetical protein